jgi:hypothetical protein|tara:strand:- start:679 stop:2109 length:1431 start_codon:yes stop_codon:yes gene_type:complete
VSAYVALFFTIIFVFVCNCSFVTTTSNHSRPHTERAMSSMPPPPPLVFGAEVDGFNKHDSTRTDDASQDLGVLRTNDEASGAKHCCVQRGYYDDPFVKHFAKTTPKHPPLINRGYHSRVATVRAVLDAFLDATFEFDAAGDDGVMPRGDDGDHQTPIKKSRQIVSLGAGFDTNYFRLNETMMTKDTKQSQVQLKYVELDFPSLIETKAKVINATGVLKEIVGTEGLKRILSASSYSAPRREPDSCFFSNDENGEGKSHYFLAGCDLRDVRSLTAALEKTNLDPKAPTLFLSECCLAYLSPQDAGGVLQWASRWGRINESKDQSIDTTNDKSHNRNNRNNEYLRTYFAYDPVVLGPARSDKFGEQMLLNLTARGCPLLRCEGEGAVFGLDGLTKQFEQSGWRRVGSIDMLAATDRLGEDDEPEMRRVMRLEPLDEVEEYRLIQKHYAIVWGVCRDGDEGGDADTLEKVISRRTRQAL